MLNLIRRLPADSELARERHGEAADWKRSDHLLRIIADRISDLTWVYTAANSETEPPRPEPLPYPGMDDEQDLEAASAADMANFFAA